MPRPNDTYFCSQCGTQLVPPPPRKKGKLWPPIFFMTLMMAVGIAIFIVTGSDATSPSATPWFSVEDGILYFDNELYTGDGQLEIPATVNGQQVTALSDGCFQDCDVLESVTLPDTLVSIGNRSFQNCDNLRGIKLTENVESIGPEAFYSCSSLEAIYIPESVGSIGINAFSACFQLKHVFFTGDREDWTALYPQYISRDTQIYSVSGPDADSYTPI